MGEYSVVYGYPAISATQPYRSNLPGLSFLDPSTLRIHCLCCFYSSRTSRLRKAKIRCQVESMVPEKRGMGSSAAVSIAAIRAVFDHLKKSWMTKP